MQREISYICENCGSKFVRKADCQKHEEHCRNRKYYIEREKLRIKNYLQRIEQKGFVVGVMYDTTANRCIISLVDVNQRKRKRK